MNKSGAKRLPRNPTRGELAADGVVHAVGLIAGIVGATILIVIAAMKGSPFEITAVSVYGFGLIAMFGFSAAYNMLRKSKRRELLRRLDHAGIFVMIAGTYTPFTLLSLQGTWSVVMTALVWSVALSGVIVKLAWPRRLEGVSTGIYLLLGFIGLVAIKPFSVSLGVFTLALLGAGGALYVIGVVFHIWEKLRYQNAIWHGFVVAAASVHYGAILMTIA